MISPPDLPALRIVEIVGENRQADGGTRVRDLREVGKVELSKLITRAKTTDASTSN